MVVRAGDLRGFLFGVDLCKFLLITKIITSLGNFDEYTEEEEKREEKSWCVEAFVSL